MSDNVQLLLRCEARVLLSALRCAAAAASGCTQASRDLREGLALLDASSSRDALERFVKSLRAHAHAKMEWHHPLCDCVSASELTLLRILADVANRSDSSIAQSPEWSTLVPLERVAELDCVADLWLKSLYAAGLQLPPPGGITATLQ